MSAAPVSSRGTALFEAASEERLLTNMTLVMTRQRRVALRLPEVNRD